MKKLFISISACLGAVLVLGACNDVQGTMTVHRSFNANNGSAVVQVPTGTYPAKLGIGPDSARITLSAGSKIEFKITNMPNLADLGPNQSIRIPGSRINQNFDVGVTREVKSLGRSGSSTRTVSCVIGTHTEPYQYCWDGHYVCRGSGRHRECDYYPGGCRTEWRTVTEYGRRDIYGYNENFRERHLLRLTDARSSTALASMNDGNQREYTEFIETGTSSCR